jgi:hypothetical protein
MEKIIIDMLKAVIPNKLINESENDSDSESESESESENESEWDCKIEECMCKCHSDKCKKCGSIQPITLLPECNELKCDCVCHICKEECECNCHDNVCFCEENCKDQECLCECHCDSISENSSENTIMDECENCNECYDDFKIECDCECHKDEDCDCDEDCDIHKCDCRVCKDLATFYVDDKEVDAPVEAFNESKCKCDLCKETHKCVHTWDEFVPTNAIQQSVKDAIDKSEDSVLHFENSRRYLQGLPNLKK